MVDVLNLAEDNISVSQFLAAKKCAKIMVDNYRLKKAEGTLRI